MAGILWFLWRIGVPLTGLGLLALCGYGISDVWIPTNIPDSLFLTSLIVAVMLLIILLVFLIEGQFFIVYRICLPAFMGMLAISVLLFFVTGISGGVDLVRSELFGSMNFYAVMALIGMMLVIESLWIALIFLIQGAPDISLKCLIGGGCMLGVACVVTFVYWIVMMLVYFFIHYYQIFFIVVGCAMGGVYLAFLVIYCIVKRQTLATIANDNLDRYWRKRV